MVENLTTANVTAIGYYYFDGAAWQKFANNPTSLDWAVGGNKGLANNNFLGTTDKDSIHIGTNNVTAITIDTIQGVDIKQNLYVNTYAEIRGALSLGNASNASILYMPNLLSYAAGDSVTPLVIGPRGKIFKQSILAKEKPFQVKNYVLDSCNQNYIANYDTGIDTSYTVILSSASFTVPNPANNGVKVGGTAGNYFIPGLTQRAFIGGSTWHINLDYAGIGNVLPINDGKWTFTLLIINNSYVNRATDVNQSLHGGNTGTGTGI